jgi:hypothetical protein
MQKWYRYLGTALLSATIMTPLAIAKPVPAIQDHDDHDRDHDRDHDNRRVYDPYHKDYHNWDNAEDRAYRGWLESRHEAYVDYNRLKQKEQREYWNWRHEHEDHDHH